MALDLGTLRAYLDLDSTNFDGVLNKLPETMRSKGALLIGAAGVVAIAAGAALGAGIAKSIEWEETQNAVSAGLGLTADESARVGSLAGRLYADAYGESMEEVQSTVGNVIAQIEGMGSANDSTVEAMTAKVLNYASAFELDAADSISQVSQLLTSGLAGSAEEAIDLMTAAMQKVPESLRGDMRDAIDEYAPFLADLGLSGEEAFAVLANGAEKGMYGIDKAGDSLKEFTIRATDMSTASVDAYDALGMNAEDMSNRILAGGETARGAFDEIVAGLLEIDDPAKRANTAIALFGTPIEDLGTEGIPDFLGSLQGLAGGLGDVEGASESMGDTLNQGTGVALTEVNRQWEVLLATLGEYVLPVLHAVMSFLAENPAVLEIVAAVVGVLAAAFVGLTIATWAMNTALLANPITWIVIAVLALIAAVVLLVMNWDEVVAFITDIWSGFVDWIVSVIDGLASWWGEVWQGIVDFFTDLWDGMISWVRDLILGYVGFWLDVWNNVASFFTDLWEGVSSFFTGLWDGLISWIRALIIAYVTFWMDVWSGAASFFTDLWENVSTGVSSVWQGILDFFGSIPDTIMGFFSGVGEWLWNVGRDLIQGLLDGIGSLASTIGNFFLDILPDWIVGPFKAALGIASPSKLFAQYGRDTVAGYLDGVDDEAAALDTRMRELVDAPSLSMAAASSAAGAPAPAATSSSRTVNYYAAEHQSLSSEEALFAALSSPRSKGDE